jgi:ABC-type transport system substrate-binding protein
MEHLYDAPYLQTSADSPIEPIVFESLLERRPMGGGRTLCIGTIREGLKFSDGSLVTAEDVVASLRLAQPLQGRCEISGSGRQVEILLAEDDPRFELELSRRWCSIVKQGDGQLLGTGAFRVREGWKPNSIVIERNEHSSHPAKLEVVEYRMYPGGAEELKAAIGSGEVDFTTALGRDDIDELKGVRKVFAPGNSTTIISFNTEHPALAKPAFRRALCEAIDRHAVTAITYENPHAFVGRNLLPPALSRRNDGIRHRPEVARKKIEESGADLSRPLRLLMMWGPRPYLPRPYETAELIVAQLAQVGVSVELVNTRDSIHYREVTREGSYDLALAGWIADSADPFDFLGANLHSDSIPVKDKPHAYASNVSRYRSGEMDDALAEYRRTGDDNALSAVMDLVADDAPLFPLFYGAAIVVHSWRLKNVDLSPTGMPKLDEVELDG